MTNRRKLVSSLVAVSILLFACDFVGGLGDSNDPAPDSGREPELEAGVELGRVMLQEDFGRQDAWELFEQDANVLKVAAGVYAVQTDSGDYIWGLNEESHTDVVMQVTTIQRSAAENNGYGIMCRADTSNDGDGYYFMISGDGFYSMRRGEGDRVNAIVDWTDSSAIRTGQASNTVVAVCIGDYLALYVNGRLVDEATDGAYGSGYAGFAAVAFEGSVDVAFDDLTIWEASRSP